MSAYRAPGVSQPEIYDRLRAAGYRLTTPRRVLVDLLCAADGPLCAEQVHAQVGATGMNLSTVYRNLNRFVDLGWLERMPGLEGQRRYRVRTGGPVAQVLCLDCGRSRPLATSLAPLQEAAAGLGFCPESLQVTLSAHCDHGCDALAQVKAG
ncbi:MAG TPA: transcriptional repressor [Anaerolineales bacterium]|nr:transcriptional repressor [Anaerolineales bacterium]